LSQRVRPQRVQQPIDSLSRAPKTAVVVLNWNGADDTLGCLESLRRSTVPVHAIVVDNDSSDSSADRIERSGLANTLLRMPTNLGYAEGNNVGLRHAIREGFDVVIVLNNDTVVEVDALSLLLSQLSIGLPRAVSPEIRYLNCPSEPWFGGAVVERGWPRYLQPGELTPSAGPRGSEWLSGCCIAARSETWERTGLFNPSYFLIFEDSEWSLRARKQGIDLLVVTESVVFHKVSASLASGPTSLLGSFYFARNGLRLDSAYFRRYVPRFIMQWLMRPTLSAIAHRRDRRDVLFRWLGALAFVCQIKGRAPRIVERLAARLI
jgi:GT2 family glycosyltransferase